MSLRYALISLLRVGPLSGYDLQKQFQVSVGHLWHAPDSQIYPELRKMEAEGLIEGEEQPRGQRATRRLYHVTADGEAAFLAWMQTPLEYARVRDPAHLRAAYLEAASPEDARAFFRRHQAQWEAELAQWEGELQRIAEVANPMLVRRLAVTDPGKLSVLVLGHTDVRRIGVSSGFWAVLRDFGVFGYEAAHPPDRAGQPPILVDSSPDKRLRRLSGFGAAGRQGDAWTSG